MSTRVTIGEFSRLTHLTVKTLHHYHDIELLVPADVDRSTGYRRYGLEQVDEALLIHRLRDLQMPLPLVQEAIRADDATQTKIISEHLRRMESALERTRDVVASLRSMIESPTSPAPISHDWHPARRVLAIRDVVDRDVISEWCADAFPRLYVALQNAGRSPAGPGGGCYSEDFFTRGQAEVMAFVPADTTEPDDRWPAGLESLELPAGNFASTEHRGPLIDFDRSYARLGSWVNAHDLTAPGPIRESYLISPADTDDPSRFVTRLSWPITDPPPDGAATTKELIMPTSTLSFAQLTVDCEDAKQLATFWSALLDQPITGEANQYVAMLAADPERGLPALLFLAVPEPRSGKNRWHVDLMSSDRHAHVDRAVALGAERRGDFEEYGTAWTTLADPEGNLFDIGLPH